MEIISHLYQMLLRMKNSWMKMQPKGRMPPMTIPGMGLVKKDCSGIWRGIWFVRTGCSIACAKQKNKKAESWQEEKIKTHLSMFCQLGRSNSQVSWIQSRHQWRWEEQRFQTTWPKWPPKYQRGLQLRIPPPKGWGSSWKSLQIQS